MDPPYLHASSLYVTVCQLDLARGHPRRRGHEEMNVMFNIGILFCVNGPQSHFAPMLFTGRTMTGRADDRIEDSPQGACSGLTLAPTTMEGPLTTRPGRYSISLTIFPSLATVG